MRQVFNNVFVIFTVLESFVAIITCLDDGSTYDFIIVGGGTAGCVLARRLTDDGNFNVLLVESGGLPKADMAIPASAPTYVSHPEVTFRYPSIPQRYAGRRNEGVLNYISGRLLGGSSSVNYMWFNRGNPRDWNNWAKITHDDSWGYDNMMKYFKKVETYEGEFPSDQHGYDGPITVSRPKFALGLDYWLKAGLEMGYRVADANGPQRISFSPVEFSKRRGQRVSSFTGYVQPVLYSRPNNLHVVVNTNVTQIIFHGITAVGIRLQTLSPEVHEISEKLIYAKREIILSAGVIGSPLILQRSGIGPKSLLEAAEIPLIKDLPVGANFRDHVAVPIHVYINNASVVLNETRDLTPKNLEMLKIHGDGPYSSARGGTGQAFTVSTTAFSEGETNWPDLHLCMSHSVQPYLSAYLVNNISNHVDTAAASSEVPMSAAVFLTRPRSHGSVFINPNDVYGLPLLDMGHFSDPKDMQSLLDGVKETVRIFERTASYKQLAARVVDVGFPACQNRVFRSDQYWKCYIRQASQAGLHAGGTCRMGSGMHDSEAVVDSKLRVIGIAGLRVVDTSIMPVQTNANTQGAVYGIAEKAADMILHYWHGLAVA